MYVCMYVFSSFRNLLISRSRRKKNILSVHYIHTYIHTKSSFVPLSYIPPHLSHKSPTQGKKPLSDSLEKMKDSSVTGATHEMIRNITSTSTIALRSIVPMLIVRCSLLLEMKNWNTYIHTYRGTNP